MSDLTRTDLQFVVSRLPRDLRNAIAKEPRLMVAGGFIRATIAGEQASDIDVFGPDPATLKLAAQSLALERKARIHETKNAITVLAPGRLPVQFVTRWCYTDPSQLLLEFDFTVAQSMVYMRDGQWQGLCAPGFYPDLAARRLVYTSPARAEDAGGSLLRVRKFLARGYTIQAPSLAAVVARLVSGINFATSLASEGETGIAMVLTGLLREVDPLTVIDGLDVVDEHEAVNAEQAKTEVKQ